MYFKLNIQRKYILIGNVIAININIIKNEYLKLPNRANNFLHIVLANNGGKIRKYPNTTIIPQISLKMILFGNPVFIHLI